MLSARSTAEVRRLLSRLGVLRCGTCGGGWWSAPDQHGKRYYMYRCSPARGLSAADGDQRDDRRDVVVEAVASRSRESPRRRRSRTESATRSANSKSARRNSRLPSERSPGSRCRRSPRTAPRAARERDQARERLAELEAAAVPAVTVSAGDWDLLTLDERRALIRAVVAQAVVRPGRGASGSRSSRAASSRRAAPRRSSSRHRRRLQGASQRASALTHRILETLRQPTSLRPLLTLLHRRVRPLQRPQPHHVLQTEPRQLRRQLLHHQQRTVRPVPPIKPALEHELDKRHRLTARTLPTTTPAASHLKETLSLAKT